MAIGLICTLEKQSTSLFQPVNRKTRLDPLQLARPLRKKGGRKFFLATWKCFFRRSMFLRLASGLRLASTRLLFPAVLSGTLTCPHQPPSQAFRAIGDAYC